ncbi:hypothetical protein HS070_14385, partial [Mannheimia haemolytica]
MTSGLCCFLPIFLGGYRFLDNLASQLCRFNRLEFVTVEIVFFCSPSHYFFFLALEIPTFYCFRSCCFL